MTRETYNRYPLGAYKVKIPPHVQKLANNTKDTTGTGQARCNELELKRQTFAFIGNGFQT